MKRAFTSTRALLTALAVMSFAVDASADWPVARHDTSRTGATPSSSNIQVPAAYWRSYLGGAPASSQVFVGDVNGDGMEDVLLVSGGLVSLQRPDGAPIWQSQGARVYSSIVDVADLDGDGKLEVIVTLRSKAAVLDGVTGALLWTAPDDVGTLQSTRLGDVDGDGKPDLWIDTCGCCAVENGSPGAIYGFASGVSSGKAISTAVSRPHCGSNSNTLGDWDGDGKQDFLVATEDKVTMYTANGSLLGTSDVIGAHLSTGRCEPIAINGIPGDEAICFENEVYGGVGERSLFMLTYNAAATPHVQLVWKTQLSALDTGEARAPAQLFADMDGDGALQVVGSGKANGVFTTSVLAADSGATIGTVPGVAVGFLPNPAGGNWLLAASNTDVLAYALTGGQLKQAWSIPNVSIIPSDDFQLARVTDVAAKPVTTDLDGDGSEDLVVLSTQEPRTLFGYSLTTGQPKMIGSHGLAASVDIASAGRLRIKSNDRLYLATNDGYLSLLDAGLNPTNWIMQGNNVVPGLRTAGYAILAGVGRGPVAANFGGQYADVYVVDSRGDLVAIDSNGATNVAPAQPIQRFTDTFGPGLNAQGNVGTIGAFRRRHPVTDTPVYVMSVLDPINGTEIASSQLSKPPTADVLPGDFQGSGGVSFVGMQVDATLHVDLHAMLGDGTPMWTQSFTADSGVEPFSVADWNGDGASDVIVAVNRPRVFDGLSGLISVDGNYPVSYFMPIIGDLDGDGLPDATLQGGYQDATGLAHDLTSVLWKAGNTDLPYPYGAIANCGGNKLLVEGSYASSAQLRITQTNGASKGATSTVVLASGAVYPDVAAAKAAAATLGQLGDVAVSANLSGGGGSPTALVGSTDGYLYAFDPCAKKLVWSLSLQAPVGSPILADTDGDGLDEILVSVADGYLYALKNQILPAPSVVNDVDPPNGVNDIDIDDITTNNILYGQWAPVPGATSYEVAVVGGNGAYLTSPAWNDVGNATQATIPNLPLVDGGIYYIGVRAVSPQGKSPDRASDGVIVHGGTPAASSSSSSTSSSAASSSSSSSSGAGGGPPDEILIYGRACTCGVVGRDQESTSLALGAWLSAIAIAVARRRRRENS
jgi:hypothetical protein